MQNQPQPAQPMTETEKRIELIQEIVTSLSEISRQDHATALLSMLAGITQRLADGDYFRAAVDLRTYAERQEQEAP